MRDPGESPRAPAGDEPGARVRAAGAGWTLSGAVIGCLAIGFALGERFDRNPEATLIGLGIGLVVGLYGLARAMGVFRGGGPSH